jgi:hypothetical protein
MMKVQYSIRLGAERLAKLKAAIARLGPYAPSVTQVIERGIDLALEELESGVQQPKRKK